MTLPQKKLREVVFQMLYSSDLGLAESKDINDLLMKELEISKKNITLAQERYDDLKNDLSEIDNLITQTSHSYAFNRIHRVEKNVLRLGVYELLFDEEIPPKVAIAEAMRLARKFSSPESANFVNAILDALFQESVGETANEEVLKQSSEALKETEKLAEEAIQQQKDD